MYDKFLTELKELDKKRADRINSEKIKQMQSLNKTV